ncbi:hypothetical protein [Methylobrevis pamukkalensis]|uniref:Uncharacterized protein n=1 Tax=Methylobrevis pamukkalensis TaxID=1439726 RepID=A0A1E3H1J9_9HYPH|nr:hypothetical protein [Methylobrevis pamukkalensis]ODN70203.1 hypothetical protein A6302_02477 [Methylobrevis pamukkalensis]
MSGPRYSIIPAGAVVDPRLEGRDLQVLALLGIHANELGWCRRSQVTMRGSLPAPARRSSRRCGG